MPRNLNNFYPCMPDKLIVLLPLAAIVLFACQSSPNEPVEPTNTSPAIESSQNISSTQLKRLLRLADEAITQDKLTYPRKESAYRYYQEILKRQPGQSDAVRGLENLVERYIELSLKALQRNQPATARSMLARAKIILPKHPSIGPTERQIFLFATAERKTINLPAQQLADQEQMLALQLSNFAKNAAKFDCRFIINAKNDAQGRWIYQKLADGFDGGRLRAQLNIRLPATVERQCFPK